MKCVLCLCLLTGFTVYAAENDYAQYVKNSAAIQRTYKEIKDQSSPQFQKLKDGIAKGEVDQDAVSTYYDSVVGKLQFLSQLRSDVDAYNLFVSETNKAIDAEADDVQQSADRKKDLADIESRKSYTATTNKRTDSTAYVVLPDGSVGTVNGTDLSSSTTTVRENRATAEARADVQKNDIQSAADKKQAKLEGKKLRAVTCSISQAQLKALEDGERQKCKYLLDKLK